ncbi:neutrophil gelatinase-associated lipocalin-like [Octodon degus]|uniref:Neutrophil gelatinase-associated lipocalin-like n=1 Tax=Octodon degus TaxID=10160 RepID=A0A6P3VCW2_OCTDE|nr:neutrophil gelatinase-associated lipocalin-like [Octodon degus]
MTVHLMCLGFILQGALKIQAQDSLPSSTPTPPLSKSPLQKDFQYERFQGKWYTMVWAPNIFWNISQSKAILQSINYTLNDDHSFNVTSNLLRDGKCEHKYDVLFPSGKSGLFFFKNIRSYNGLQKFTFKVLDTDYNQFATVLLNRIGQEVMYIEHRVYARSKQLNPELKEHYLNVTRSLGLPDRFVTFTDHHEAMLINNEQQHIEATKRRIDLASDNRVTVQQILDTDLHMTFA